MTLRVGEATSRDADPIRALDGLSPPSRRLLEHDLEAPDRCCVVAHLDDEVVGYAAAFVHLDETQVLDVVVAPAWRRRGIATRLLGALTASAVQRGATATTLEVGADNVGAQALYRRLGFVVEGRRPRYYPGGEDALIMWRRPRTAASDTGGPDAGSRAVQGATRASGRGTEELRC